MTLRLASQNLTLGGHCKAQTSQGICTNDSKGNYFHENLDVLEAMHAIQAQEASHFFHDTLAHHLRVSRFVVFLVPNALKNSKITPEIQKLKLAGLEGKFAVKVPSSMSFVSPFSA